MSISSYTTKDGKTLWKVYVNLRSKDDPSIREQKVLKGIESKKAATSTEKKLIKELSAKIAKREGLELPWDFIIDSWENHMKEEGFKKLSLSSMIDGLSLLRKWTKPWLDRPAVDINRADVRDIFRELDEKEYSLSTKRKVRHFINTIYTWGIEERLIKDVRESPAQHYVIAKQKNEKLEEVLNIDQIRVLLREAKNQEHPWYPIWFTALLTGMRNGELHALIWNDVDLEERIITVSKSYNTRTRSVKATKSGNWRKIPINDELYSVFLKLKISAGSREHVLPRFWQWDKGEQAKILRTFCVGIGVPSIRFHSLRASFATQLLANSVAPSRVMKVCGWKELKTMQHYVRLAGIDEHGATDCLKVMVNDSEVMDLAAKVI